MKKAFSEFIEAKDVEALFVENWKEKMTPERVVSYLLNQEKSLDDKFSIDSPAIKKKCEAYGIVLPLADILTLSFRFLIQDIHQQRDITFFKSVIDSNGVYRGELMVSGCLSSKCVEDSPIDTLIQDHWDTVFNIIYRDCPIYPNTGLHLYSDSMAHDFVRNKLGVENHFLYWHELSLIYNHFFPGCDKNNMMEYYSNLRSIGIYPVIQSVDFYVAKELGAIKEGVEFKDFHKTVRTGYIEF